MRQRSEMRAYQNRGVRFVKSHRHGGLLMDMGLGKTITTLTGIKELIDEGEIERVLVAAPKRVAQGVWRQEAREWRHTRKLTFKLLHGNERQRLMAMNSKAQIHLITTDNLRWLLYVLRHYMKRKSFVFPYDMLVIDESAMFKTPSSKRFSALRYCLKWFKRRLILTGKPQPNSLIDLWSQIFIIDLGRRLGESVDRYRTRFFHPAGFGGYKYEPDEATDSEESAEEAISRLIAPVVLTLRAEDYLKMPKEITQKLWVDLPPNARAIYQKLQEEMFHRLDEGDVVADNAAALTNKCHQLANGVLYYEDDRGARKWKPIHDEKLQALKEVFEVYDGNILVPYHFKPDLVRLRAAFPKLPVVADAKTPRALERLQNEWNAGKHRGMFVHPQGGGHGLNLQKACNCIVFFSLLWPHDPYDQVINRIGKARQVGRKDHYHVKWILARNTVDEVLLESQLLKYTKERKMIALLKKHRDLMEMLS